jgi:hypothetical protein
MPNIEVSPDGHPVIGGDWSGKTIIDVGCRGGQFCQFSKDKGAQRVLAFDGNAKGKYGLPVGTAFTHAVVTGAWGGESVFDQVLFGDDEDWVTDLVLTDLAEEKFPRKVGMGVRSYKMWEVLQLVSDVEPSSIILKLDCEGSEYGILFDVLALPTTFAQITVEFHEFLGLEPFEGARRTIEAGMAVRYTKIPVAHLVPKGPGDDVVLWVSK